MFNTYERELIANQRHEDLLRSFSRNQRITEAIETERPAGLLATLAARLRGSATEAQIARAAIA